MKKGIIVGFCLVLLGSGAFALEKAAGGGLLGGYTFQGGTESLYGYNYEWTFNRGSFGACAFFGLSQWVEFNLAFMYKSGEAEVTVEGTTTSVPDEGVPQPTSALGFGVYGKYPIPISDAFVFFPTGGVDVELNFEKDWWSDIWIRGGLGIDFFFTDTLFLRSHLIYGVVLPFGDTELSPQVGHGLLAKAAVGFMF
ncbi:MAG: hypothetical protein LBU25_11650 [Treponema sp.]|nr:hypothetical protein [Treponema sp.]